MGDAFFSVLEPQGYIKFHSGPLNVKITVHLPVIVPHKTFEKDERKCAMQVCQSFR